MKKETTYLLIVIQIEGEVKCELHTSLKEAEASFKDETEGEYNIGVAIYDLSKTTNFGRGEYGFFGDPIKEWENENF